MNRRKSNGGTGTGKGKRKSSKEPLVESTFRIPDALKPASKEEHIKETKKHMDERIKEIDLIFKELGKGVGTDDIARKLWVAPSYVSDMARKGKEGALAYWKELYGVKE